MLTWSEDDECWISSTEHGDLGFVFRIHGTPVPQDTTLEQAVEIAGRKDVFVRQVEQFLKEEASTWKDRFYTDEILCLTIESIDLGNPGWVNGGMISLDGGKDYRAWRCDYADGVLSDLGFDS